MQNLRPGIVLVTSAFAFTVACSGEIGGSMGPDGTGGTGDGMGGTGVPPGTGATGGGGSMGGPAPPPNPITCGKPVGGAAPARRLTRDEYNNTVRDLLGDATAPARTFIEDGAVDFFESNVNSPVTSAIATDYQNAAEKLAMAARLQAPLLPCTTQDDACARQFVTSFGKKAFRRPMTDREVTGYAAVYTAGRGRGADFPGALRLVMQAFLQSPYFVNHIEIGTGMCVAGSKAVPLTGYEIASRLSYFLRQTMPDELLFAAADSGRLATAEGIATEATRLVNDARTTATKRTAVTDFYRQWLEIDVLDSLTKDPKLIPVGQTAPGLGKMMRTEIEQFISSVVWDADKAGLESLFKGSWSFVNGPLAQLYGRTDVTGTAFTRVELEPDKRPGLLTRLGFLSHFAYDDQTDPVHRGLFVRERLLCQAIPPPPPDVTPIVPKATAGKTARDRWAPLLANPLCGSCHMHMNPIGLAMENYDALGRYRTTENGVTINPEVKLTGSDVDGTYANAVAMNDALSKSGMVRDCVSDNWFGYALGRARTDGDSCSLQRLRYDFAQTGNDLRQILVATVKTDAFRYRTPTGSEVCP